MIPTRAHSPTTDPEPQRAARTIALLIETGGPGGAERMLLQLADELAARGHEVVPVLPSTRNPWLGEQFVARGFRPERYADPQGVRALGALLRRRGVQVAHCHEFTMGVFGAAAAWLQRIPYVLTMHGGRYYAERWQRRAALRLAARHARALVGVSQATVRDLERTLQLRPGAVRMIHNGIAFQAGNGDAVRRELAVPDGEPLIVCVGNLYPVKGHIVLLRALVRLQGDGALPRWHVAIAGRGGEEAALLAFAAEHGVADRVHLLGYRSDVADVLAAADIYAMPSLSEGLPLGLLEAMYARKPIMASDVGGIPEAVRDGETALLVAPGDHEAVSDALRRLLTDHALRTRLADAAHRDVLARFSVRHMADAYEALYRGTGATAGERPRSEQAPPARWG